MQKTWKIIVLIFCVFKTNFPCRLCLSAFTHQQSKTRSILIVDIFFWYFVFLRLISLFVCVFQHLPVGGARLGLTYSYIQQHGFLTGPDKSPLPTPVDHAAWLGRAGLPAAGKPGQSVADGGSRRAPRRHDALAAAGAEFQSSLPAATPSRGA